MQRASEQHPIFIMTPSLVSFLKAKQQRKAALQNAQLAHLRSKKYRGVAYSVALANAPVHANLTYRGISYQR